MIKMIALSVLSTRNRKVSVNEKMNPLPALTPKEQSSGGMDMIRVIRSSDVVVQPCKNGNTQIYCKD